MIEKLEIVGKNVKSCTKDEFTKFLADEVCAFFNDAPSDLSPTTNLAVKLTLTMFSAQITKKLFNEED